jgi:hypothetical protein
MFNLDTVQQMYKNLRVHSILSAINYKIPAVDHELKYWKNRNT